MNGRWLSLALLVTPGAVAAQCRLCATPTAAATSTPARALSIEIEAALDLGRAANARHGGSIAIDGHSGSRAVSGLVDLGGFAIVGRARLSGEPFRHVQIDLPPSIRLTAASGSSAEAVALQTDLPPDPQLDAAGQLAFAFGGKLLVAGDAAGDFRGRIAITAEYR